jgi:hypothetical protein
MAHRDRLVERKVQQHTPPQMKTKRMVHHTPLVELELRPNAPLLRKAKSPM